MSNFDEELKKAMEHSHKTFRQGELNGALTVINRLMSEFIEHKYTTVNQLMGAIQVIGDELNYVPMTSEQYESEAKADHRTDV